MTEGWYCNRIYSNSPMVRESIEYVATQKMLGRMSDLPRFGPLPSSLSCLIGGPLPTAQVRKDVFCAIHAAVCGETRTKGYQCCDLYAITACIVLRALTGGTYEFCAGRTFIKRLPAESRLSGWQFNPERYPAKHTLGEEDFAVDHAWVEVCHQGSLVAIDFASWQYTRYFAKRWSVRWGFLPPFVWQSFAEMPAQFWPWYRGDKYTAEGICERLWNPVTKSRMRSIVSRALGALAKKGYPSVDEGLIWPLN